MCGVEVDGVPEQPERLALAQSEASATGQRAPFHSAAASSSSFRASVAVSGCTPSLRAVGASTKGGEVADDPAALHGDLQRPRDHPVM